MDAGRAETKTRGDSFCLSQVSFWLKLNWQIILFKGTESRRWSIWWYLAVRFGEVAFEDKKLLWCTICVILHQSGSKTTMQFYLFAFKNHSFRLCLSTGGWWDTNCFWNIAMKDFSLGWGGPTLMRIYMVNSKLTKAKLFLGEIFIH